MNTDTLLEKIAHAPQITDHLAGPLDFMATDQQENCWFSVKPDIGCQIIARDGAGGLFALCGAGTEEDRPVLYASSEGQAGLIATTLAQALQAMIALPYWRDCLKFSGGGRIEEMMKTLPYLERELHEDEPDFDNVRLELLEGLGLTMPGTPLESLHHCLTNPPTVLEVIGEDGSVFVSLFGRFVFEDNPMWRRAPITA